MPSRQRSESDGSMDVVSGAAARSAGTSWVERVALNAPWDVQSNVAARSYKGSPAVSTPPLPVMPSCQESAPDPGSRANFEDLPYR